MTENEAYKVIAKHIFIAHKQYEGKSIIIIDGNIEEARKKAVKFFGSSKVFIKRIYSTDHTQIYEFK